MRNGFPSTTSRVAVPTFSMRGRSLSPPTLLPESRGGWASEEKAGIGNIKRNAEKTVQNTPAKAFRIAVRKNIGKAGGIALSGSKNCDVECLRCAAEHPLLTKLSPCTGRWEIVILPLNRNVSFSFKNSVLPRLSLEFSGP